MNRQPVSGALLGPLPGRKAVDDEIWGIVNRTAIAKAISELSYEEGFAPVALNKAETMWTLTLGDAVSYRFEARRRIWEQLHIDPKSLVRATSTEEAVANDAVGFLAEARDVLDISPATFCTYAKELYNTLMADARIVARRAAFDASELAGLSDTELQTLLDGHPKAPANKGRLGWGLQDSETYAPEFDAPIQLFWLAAARNHCQLALAHDLTEPALLAECLGT